MNNISLHKDFISLPLVAFLFIMVAASCSKDSSRTNSSSSSDYNTEFQGKWNIVVDSIYAGVGPNNQLVPYVGYPGDFYDFRANGILYISERIGNDTTTYQLDSADKIFIPLFGGTVNNVPQLSTIDSLTSNVLIINSPYGLSPAGIFWRKVILSR